MKTFLLMVALTIGFHPQIPGKSSQGFYFNSVIYF